MSSRGLKELAWEGGLKHRDAQLQSEKKVAVKGEGGGFLLFLE